MSFLVQLDNLNTQEGSHTTTATPTLTLVNFLEGRTLKAKAPLKTLYLFLYLSEGFFLYHLTAYLNGFILSHYSKFLGAPFMA